LENPVNVPKTANRKITTLQIKEEQHLGSLTCHVFRHASHPIFDKFNATTKGLAFSNAGTYDPYNFGKKLQRYYNCDIYLTDANFDELLVDLEVVLILQPRPTKCPTGLVSLNIGRVGKLGRMGRPGFGIMVVHGLVVWLLLPFRAPKDVVVPRQIT